MKQEDRETLEHWRDLINATLDSKPLEIRMADGQPFISLKDPGAVLAHALRHMGGKTYPERFVTVRIKREPRADWVGYERMPSGQWAQAMATQSEEQANAWLHKESRYRRKIVRVVEDLNSEKFS